MDGWPCQATCFSSTWRVASAIGESASADPSRSRVLLNSGWPGSAAIPAPSSPDPDLTRYDVIGYHLLMNGPWIGTDQAADYPGIGRTKLYLYEIPRTPISRTPSDGVRRTGSGPSAAT